jgi:hypothetical protein
MHRPKIDSDKILSFALSVFVFILIIDPTNTIFRLKDISFVFVVGLSVLHYTRIKTLALITIILIYLIVVSTFIFGYLSVYEFDFRFTIGILKGFSPLILLLWIDKYKLVKKLVLPSFFICLLIIITLLTTIYNSKLFGILYKFYMDHDATMMIGRRSFLGVALISFFYKSLPVLIIPASILTYKFFYGTEKRKLYFLLMILFLTALFLGGTRACMLAVLSLILINLLLWLSRSNLGKLIIIPTFIVILFAFSILVFNLISEKNESSNKVKFAHIDSYSDLIIKHPAILLTGQGAGSLFYSKGINGMLVQTELSYFEIIRMFGLVGAFFVITLFVIPLYIIYKKRKVLKLWIPMFIGYMLYLFVGGTNPLLLGSTGMLVLISAYSYSLNPYYESEEW